MRKIIVFALFIFISVLTFAQSSGLYWRNLDSEGNRLDGKITGETYYMGAEANRYFFLQKDWVQGTIVLTDGSIYENVRLRYLARFDELIMYNDNRRSLFIVDKEIVQSFSFPSDGRELTFVRLPFKTIFSSYRYFREMFTGTCNLYAFHSVQEYNVSMYKDENGIMRNTEFHPMVDYFMFRKDGTYEKFQLKRKSFIRVFPEQKKAIKKLFRKNGLMIDDENSLIEAFKLLDENGILR